MTDDLLKENIPALEKGAQNLAKMIENMKLFGVPVVVAINSFATDTANEIEALKKLSLDFGAEAAVMSNHWAQGGEGARELAEATAAAAEKPSNFKFLYELDRTIEEKIETIATKIYGADGVDFLPLAKKKIKQFNESGFDKLPICMAKTHLSLSHDPTLKGRPTDFRVPIRDIKASVGAGPICIVR